MTGLRVIVAGWLTVAVIDPVWGTVSQGYEYVGLNGVAGLLATFASIVASLMVLGVAARRTWRWCRRAGQAVNTILELPAKLDTHQAESTAAWANNTERLDSGDRRMEGIEKKLDVLANTERAAVKGALQAVEDQARRR